MSYYGCETCKSNIVALLADTDSKTDPKIIRICKETRLMLPDSMVGCPKYPYAERKKIVDSCLICPNIKTKFNIHSIMEKIDVAGSYVCRCSITGEDVLPIGGGQGIPSTCPYLKEEK